MSRLYEYIKDSSDRSKGKHNGWQVCNLCAVYKIKNKQNDSCWHFRFKVTSFVCFLYTGPFSAKFPLGNHNHNNNNNNNNNNKYTNNRSRNRLYPLRYSWFSERKQFYWFILACTLCHSFEQHNFTQRPSEQTQDGCLSVDLRFKSKLGVGLVWPRTYWWWSKM
jgi:hypothetical protein